MPEGAPSGSDRGRAPRRRQAALSAAAFSAAAFVLTAAGGAATGGDGTVEALVAFAHSPFPYDGMVPGATPQDDRPFLQSDPDGRRFHLAPRGGKLYEPTYADRRSLLVVPPRFDPRKPGACLVVFFHGNLATLRDVAARQGVPRQLVQSHLDAALVAPQLAVDALDSSAGHFYEPGFFETYLHEAARHLAERAGGRFSADEIDALPVVLVAYSGGYVPAAYTLAAGAPQVKGVVLLDALFGETQKFADWVARRHADSFFVSAYSKASAPLNVALEATVRDEGIAVDTALPAAIAPGAVVFQAAPDATHDAFVTAAWTKDPLAALLARVRVRR